jgi:hypothetical protein
MLFGISLFKIAVVIVLLMIIGSLFSALFFLNKDEGGTRTAKALTVRISLSIGLFIFLMLGYYFGLIGHH